MKLISENKEANDCVIVAVYNALKLHGARPNYRKLRKEAISRGWFNPKKGFETGCLDSFLSAQSIDFSEYEDGSTTVDIKEKVRGGGVAVLVIKNLETQAGHAVLAIKGSVGVKVLNPGNDYPGWRSICRGLKNNKIALCAWSVEGIKA